MFLCNFLVTRFVQIHSILSLSFKLSFQTLFTFSLLCIHLMVGINLCLFENILFFQTHLSHVSHCLKCLSVLIQYRFFHFSILLSHICFSFVILLSLSFFIICLHLSEIHHIHQSLILFLFSNLHFQSLHSCFLYFVKHTLLFFLKNFNSIFN